MKTIVQEFKDKAGLDDSSDNELLDAEEKIEELEDQLEEKENQLEYAITEQDCNVYNTALGKILVYNVAGNLQLQQELDEFFELIQAKYL